MRLYEKALQLYRMGYSVGEIGRILYPGLRDSRARWNRANFLVRYALSKSNGVDAGDSMEIRVYDRDSSQSVGLSIWMDSDSVARKRLRGDERFKVEYEELLYMLYQETIRPYDRGLMFLFRIKVIHDRVFPRFWELYRKRIWFKHSQKYYPPVSMAYCYLVLLSSILYSPIYRIQEDLLRRVLLYVNPGRRKGRFRVDEFKEFVVRLLPLFSREIAKVDWRD